MFVLLIQNPKPEVRGSDVRFRVPGLLAIRHSLTRLRHGWAFGRRNHLEPAVTSFLRFPAFCARGAPLVAGAIPEAKTAPKSIGVVALAATLGQLLQFFYIASAENDIVGFEGGDQPLHHVRFMTPPFLFSSLLQAALADVILISSVLVRKVS